MTRKEYMRRYMAMRRKEPAFREQGREIMRKIYEKKKLKRLLAMTRKTDGT